MTVARYRSTASMSCIAVAAALFLSPGDVAQAQTKFPTSPLKLVVPFAAGGVADTSSRIMAERLGEHLGQRIVIENVPGAGGIQAARNVLSAPADGHTLALLTNGTAISVGLFKQLPFDPLTQFQPVSALGFFEFVFFTGADSKHKTLGELLKAAKARPGALNIGTIVPGSTQHLTAELFRSSADIDIKYLPFKTTPDLLISAMRNDVDVVVEALAPIKSNLEAGQMRALAVTSPSRSPALPDVPTAAEAGVPNFDVLSWNAIYVKQGTAPEIVDVLYKAMRVTLQEPDVKARLLALGINAQSTTPQEIEQRMKEDIARWSAVIQKAGIERP